MRILIIGGTRFMGPLVVRYLHAQGHDITLFHRGQTQTETLPGVQEILGNRRPLAPHARDLQRLAPDVVLDMIPVIEQDALELMNAFTGIARRIVAISSQDVYRAYGRVNGTEPGPPDPVPLTEDAPLREKLYPYRGETPRAPDDPGRWNDDYDKILVERHVMGDPKLPGTALRLPMVYGPGDYQHRLFPFLKRMDDRRLAILLGEGEARWRWTHGYVENVAAAIALAVTDERASNRIYNVGEAGAFSMSEWISKIAQFAGWAGKIVTVPPNRLPAHLAEKIDTNQHLVTDSTRIRQELGYSEPIPLNEALKRTVAWERANPAEGIDAKQFDYAAEDVVLATLES
jgi:nucleoside-diphosphate-sugar epimerase